MDSYEEVWTSLGSQAVQGKDWTVLERAQVRSTALIHIYALIYEFVKTYYGLRGR